MIEAVIFDMDGLLIDSEVFWEDARSDYARSEGCTWRPEDELGVKGHNSVEWAEAIQRRCKFERSPDEIIQAVTSRMRTLYTGRLPLLPGATEVVRSLAGAFPLAIASSSPSQLIEYVLTQARLFDLFQVVVSADHAGRGKPAPDVFLAAAEGLGRAAQTCAVFEDSSAGITAARAAHMFVIAVPNPHYPPAEKALQSADVVLASLLDFRPEMLQREWGPGLGA